MIIQNLRKTFGSRVIIDSFSYTFPEKTIIALTGVNGAGKTTLIKILCKEETADSGTVMMPKDKVLGYLPQEPNENPESTILQECYAGNEKVFQTNLKLIHLEEKLAHDYSEEVLEEFEEVEIEYKNMGGYSFENTVQKILLGLGFSKKQFEDNPSNLSGGWRMRLELGRILVKEPDLLILDEPTNHLDLPSIEWLEEYLKKFKGTVLFVSHDEALLNNLPDRILNLAGGFIKEYNGNYEDFLEQKEADETNKDKSAKNIQKKVKQLSKFVQRFKAKASLAKQAQNKMKQIQKLNNDIAALGPNILQPEINIKIPIVTESGKNVVVFEGSIGYKTPLVKDFNFNIMRGQKIAIIGANGLGKSTFLKTLVKEIPLQSGTMKFGSNVNIGYYAQDQANELDVEKNVLENIKQANPEIAENKLMRILGSFLFKKDNIYKKAGMLSGGEKSRLSLACLLVRDLNFLVLDEPTNHLDMITCQILAKALSEYEGTVIFVSHNRTFIDEVSTNLLEFENGKVKISY